MKIKYELLHKEKHTNARYGTLETNYGKFETPMFMPVGSVYYPLLNFVQC